MCIANNNDTEVDFFNTILLGHVCADGDQLLGYYNNIPPMWFPTEDRGNAMLFALPAVPGSVTADSLVPMADLGNLMVDYRKAVAPVRQTRGGSRGIYRGIAPAATVVKDFDGGAYDVVIASGARAILSVIDEVAQDKRPDVNQQLYTELDLLYPGFTFVLFCFAQRWEEQAGSATIKYTPMEGYRDKIFLPGLDGHRGSVTRGWVSVDHTLVLSSHELIAESSDSVRAVSFSDANVPEVFPRFVIGKKIQTHMRNGDFLFKVDDVSQGIFEMERAVPPGSANLPATRRRGSGL